MSRRLLRRLLGLGKKLELSSNTSMEVILIVNSNLLDLLATRIRDSGVDCILSPPCAIRLNVEEHETNDKFWVGFTNETAENVCSALLGMGRDRLVNTLLPGFNASAMISLPYKRQSDGNLHLHYVRGVAMLYNQVPGPEIYPCELGERFGGCWLLFRAEEVSEDYFRMEDIELQDGEQICTIAKALISKDQTY